MHLPSPESSGDITLLTDGVSRDELDAIHHWQSNEAKPTIHLEWDKPIELSQIEIKADTDLQRKIMMHKRPEKAAEWKQINKVPPELVKAMKAEVRVKGRWIEVARKEDNLHRMINFDFPQVKTTAVRLSFEETWGADKVKLFELRCYA